MITALLFLLSVLVPPTLTISPDGAALLAFKYTVLADPDSVLSNWNYEDESPCSWNGVVCMGFTNSNANSTTFITRVISLVLPNTGLVGSIPTDLGLLDNLRHLDLSGNALNGTLPPSILNASELRVLSLANNAISGQIPQFSAPSLQVVNLSNNGFSGGIPNSLAALPNLTTVSLSHNFLTGELPAGGFRQVQVLDLSANLLNGSLPVDIAGTSLNYLNLSSNRLSGEIAPELGNEMPAIVTIDLSFNNLSGEVPTTGVFQSQKPEYFAGNPNLCGKLLSVLCPYITQPPSPPPLSPTISPSMSPPAIAVIPKIPGGDTPATGTNGGRGQRKSSGSGKLSPAAIIAITVGDMLGIGILFSVLMCVYKVKRKRRLEMEAALQHKMGSASLGTREITAFSCCLTSKCGCGSGGEDDSSDTVSSDGEEETKTLPDSQLKQQEAKLVTVDGELELEMETLLKASAYILGVTGPEHCVQGGARGWDSIGGPADWREWRCWEDEGIEAQVRSVAKLRHPNLLRLRGFYWASNEKLLISDYAPNGSLANISFTNLRVQSSEQGSQLYGILRASLKHGSSPFHLRWDARLRIAQGVAKGLAFLHEKRQVHGNLKPSNILLNSEMEPWIADLGLERLLIGNKSGRAGTSARHFGSKRSLFSQNSPLPELSPNLASGGPSPAAGSAMFYQAPESLQNLKPSPKLDVFSFGMVFLELMGGRAFSEAEVNEWNAGFVEEGGRVIRMADPAIRGDVQGKEEALSSCFRLGFCCAAVDPQRRPTMKEALQVLERVVSASSTTLV